MTVGAISGSGSIQPFSPYYGTVKNTSDAASFTGSVSTGEANSAPGSTDAAEGTKKAGYKSSPGECETCKNRKYQDGSNENVSFKSASHISPEAAAAAVRAHEGEHVSNAYNKAAEKNGKVVSASVRIDTAVCPECGRVYVSGGETTTQIKYPNENNPYQKNARGYDASKTLGMNLDMAV